MHRLEKRDRDDLNDVRLHQTVRSQEKHRNHQSVDDSKEVVETLPPPRWPGERSASSDPGEDKMTRETHQTSARMADMKMTWNEDSKSTGWGELRWHSGVDGAAALPCRLSVEQVGQEGRRTNDREEPLRPSAKKTGAGCDGASERRQGEGEALGGAA